MRNGDYGKLNALKVYSFSNVLSNDGHIWNVLSVVNMSKITISLFHSNDFSISLIEFNIRDSTEMKVGSYKMKSNQSNINQSKSITIDAIKNYIVTHILRTIYRVSVLLLLLEMACIQRYTVRFACYVVPMFLLDYNLIIDQYSAFCTWYSRVELNDLFFTFCTFCTHYSNENK